MRTLGNIIWFLTGGIVGFVLWFALGCLLAITIIGIPFAKAAWRISVIAAFPFGKELVDARMVGEERVIGTGFLNFLWFILAGLWLGIFHVLAGIACFSAFILIFPIYFGLAHMKLASAAFAPLGKRILLKDEVLIRQQQMNRELELARQS